MTDEAAVKVENLSKCYHIYDQPRHRLFQMLFRGRRQYYREFWAIHDLSFSIKRGQIVGILGKNGAGKSTLLQIICGTLNATGGEISVDGRIAALLELGSGFNPDFTGVENIYLNGKILGLDEDEINNKLEDILEFADIGDFVHQPVKTYSSGMFARLAFSVAVNVEPEILIVDEALSVGDAWFQHKSMARMRQLMETGCTVLFVSHSIDAVRAVCDTAIWLEQGSLKMIGGVTEVTNAYMNDVFIEHNRIALKSMRQATLIRQGSEPSVASESGVLTEKYISINVADTECAGLNNATVLTVRSIKLKNRLGQVTDHLSQGESFSLEFELDIHKRTNNLSLGFIIKDQFGQDLTGESYFNTIKRGLNLEPGQLVVFIFESDMLLRGGQSYSIALRVNQVTKWDRSDNVVIYADELAMVFDVLANTENPMWFKFKMPFKVSIR
jgi:lipopolysaccharide transport system ATP-binding protein